MKNNEVLNYMESLEKEDKHLDLFVKMYKALSSFLTDFDFLRDSKGLTQKDVADKMETTQSAISRIASMKTNPSYKQLQKMAEAVGGELLITPMKDMTVQVPYDLQNTVQYLAKSENKTTNEYLDEVIRKTLLKEIERRRGIEKMGNTSTEKKKRRLRRKKDRQRTESQKNETLCISCGNQERTVDDTGRCESCRRELYETDCAMCDFD